MAEVERSNGIGSGDALGVLRSGLLVVPKGPGHAPRGEQRPFHQHDDSRPLRRGDRHQDQHLSLGARRLRPVVLEIIGVRATSLPALAPSRY